MDRLDAMRLFTRIVELGSFTAAADDLNLPRATVTHSIKRLETRLGTQLLRRTTRRVQTTRDGEAYYSHCVRLLAEMDAVETDFREANVQPRGRLRIDVPAQMGRLWLIPALPAFFARYPLLELDIGTGDHFVDLLREGVDCVLRVGKLPDSGLVGRRVGMLEQLTVASTSYVRKHGAPQTLADLQHGHYAVNWTSPTTHRNEPLEFMVGRKRREVSMPGFVAVSGVEAYLACCEHGLGIAQFPRYRVAEALANGTLRQILPAMPPPSLPVTVLYPPHRQLPARLRVFVDWMVDVMSKQL
ncbi:LysR family transcriptional regulator [Dyella acidiphila]|uniref:LysR family transcriptional regulator n=1 Tax=Dyella acidiphila TaxID=2775866 RepID=A0ABR9G5X5_9GAMM|nr:LysR family transcriptional regulator [Dyella acidiphila]MBE1159451.1 LysR family transcriptional regulator [Dyella acidiphila]